MNTHQSKQDILSLLQDHEFLRGVDEAFVESLATMGKRVELPAGTLIFNAGEPALTCHLMIEGLVVLEICDSIVGCSQIQTIGRGELLGWSALFPDARMSARARAIKPTIAVELDGQRVRQLCRQFPTFGCQLMSAVARTLSKRLTATRLQLIDVYRREQGSPVWQSESPNL